MVNNSNNHSNQGLFLFINALGKARMNKRQNSPIMNMVLHLKTRKLK